MQEGRGEAGRLGPPSVPHFSLTSNSLMTRVCVKCQSVRAPPACAPLPPTLLTDLKQLDDAGVCEVAHDADLALHALRLGRVRQAGLVNDLDCHAAATEMVDADAHLD